MKLGVIKSVLISSSSDVRKLFCNFTTLRSLQSDSLSIPVTLPATISHLADQIATANFTTAEQQKTFQQLLCSAGLTDKLSDQMTLLSVLHSFLSVTASLGNALILIALHKESSIHPPSKLLLRCLATTDLCVGLIAEPVHATSLISALNEHWNLCHYTSVADFITGYILCGISGATLSAISVDRLLALLLGLRYSSIPGSYDP